MPRTISIAGKQVTWTSSDSDLVVLDLVASQYYSLNATAAALWPLIAAGTDETHLVSELVQSFEIDTERASRDVAVLIGELASRGLITVTECDPSSMEQV